MAKSASIAIVAVFAAAVVAASVAQAEAEPPAPANPIDEVAILRQFWQDASSPAISVQHHTTRIEARAELIADDRVLGDTLGAGGDRSIDDYAIGESVPADAAPWQNIIDAPTFTAHREQLWFSLIPSGCEALGGSLSSTPCHRSGGPHVYTYNTVTKQLVDRSPADPRLEATLAVHSAGALQGIVLFGGPAAGEGINLFAFRADDGQYLGSATLHNYADIGKPAVVRGSLYVPVGNTSGGGSVLRWTGTEADPFQFEVVGLLDGICAEVVAHEGRLFVATWPSGDSLAGIYMSPVITKGGLTAGSVRSWEQVWRVDAYEPDEVVARTYRCGALASFGGYLYWATSHVPLLAAEAHFARRGLPSSLNEALAAIAGTHRATSVFRGHNFGTYPQTELLYGMSRLPVYDGGWRLVPNATGQPLWGPAGFGDSFNWAAAMTVHRGHLYISLANWSNSAIQRTIGFLKSAAGYAVTGSEQDALPYRGASLLTFESTTTPAIPVSLRCDGCGINFDASTMVSAEALYVCTAGAAWEVGTAAGNAGTGGWNLFKLAGNRTRLSDAAEAAGLSLSIPPAVEPVNDPPIAAPTKPTAIPTPTPSPDVPLAAPALGPGRSAERSVEPGTESALSPDKLWPGGRAPTPVTKVSKLGIGVYGLHAGDDMVDNVRRIQPSIILLQDPDIDFARKVRYLCPNALIIGRTFFPEQPLDNPEQRGIAAADKVAEVAVPFKGLIDAWMSYNEPVGHNDYAGYEAYNRFQVAFAKRLQGHYGIPAVAGNDPPGAIEPRDYARYFAEAIRASRYFGVHAYAGPDAASFRTPDRAYYALRYRLIHDELEKAGIENVQMVITEAGLGAKWRGRVSEEMVAEEFKWLADELQKDPYVVGMAVFGLFVGNTWPDFDITGTRIVDLLGEYQPQ